jgi:hypothetical protein
MKALAFFAFLVGAIAFWSLRPEGSARDETRSDAVAVNYALFRNAVFDFALASKTQGNVLPGDSGLALPSGWRGLRDWHGLIQEEEENLFCYVFGPMEPDEIAAVQKLFNYSRTVGWNNAGVLNRNGDPLPLPAIIPHGAVVSVIRLD